ncbi:hypothetical protein F441_19145 [Phytophthora nicotianae CJ01A1]|uniref:Uncharacterized protein n=3 Tax=Phytophthora nicotianae TaxID=4792 RepID=W2W0E7_PHYNI|nr:hypothetical protein L916_18651 [Phytophthora nicotianae]ETO62902.1 hypothetical protein F444_19274 [Phytophthora nicotianae P1976]ETP04012.1 hypothetical protein F441_19145 [Phytophthora nicotianae CJ01A1]
MATSLVDIHIDALKLSDALLSIDEKGSKLTWYRSNK